MGQILHGCAKTTEAVRMAIKNSQESLKALAQKYAINPKWKKGETVKDAPMGPKNPHSTTLTLEEEAACVAFRKHMLLPLDDCLYALQSRISGLTRSSLHRIFQRHGISRLPEVGGDKQAKKKFKAYPIGYFHIDKTVSAHRGGKTVSVCRHRSHIQSKTSGHGHISLIVSALNIALNTGLPKLTILGRMGG